MNIAITGANGFVGHHLCQYHKRQGHHVTAIVRRENLELCADETWVFADYSRPESLSSKLAGTEVVIHLAGIAHTHSASPRSYYEVNLHQTLTIAKAAAAAKVKQFIFFSSIKVNGEYTTDTPFSCHDSPCPQGDYAISKLLAEQALDRLCKEDPMQLVIIRPPLIYGSVPKGNLKLIAAALKCRIPLPLKNIDNRRDMVSLDNIASLLDCILLNPSLKNKILLVSDGKAISTSELIQQLAKANNVSALMFTCPKFVASLLDQIPITKGMYRRLFGNMEVDLTSTLMVTDWKPKPRETT